MRFFAHFVYENTKNVQKRHQHVQKKHQHVQKKLRNVQKMLLNVQTNVEMYKNVKNAQNRVSTQTTNAQTRTIRQDVEFQFHLTHFGAFLHMLLLFSHILYTISAFVCTC